jgi:hypothetical protein
MERSQHQHLSPRAGIQSASSLARVAKNRVYQAHDTLLDCDVAFALLKTEGFERTHLSGISSNGMPRLAPQHRPRAGSILEKRTTATPHRPRTTCQSDDACRVSEDAPDWPCSTAQAVTYAPRGRVIPKMTTVVESAPGVSIIRTYERRARRTDCAVLPAYGRQTGWPAGNGIVPGATP